MTKVPAAFSYVYLELLTNFFYYCRKWMTRVVGNLSPIHHKLQIYCSFVFVYCYSLGLFLETKLVWLNSHIPSARLNKIKQELAVFLHFCFKLRSGLTHTHFLNHNWQISAKFFFRTHNLTFYLQVNLLESQTVHALILYKCFDIMLTHNYTLLYL